MSGIITSQIYDNTGKFNLAYDLNKSKYNEKVITTLHNSFINDDIEIYQIAGFFVRRIENEKYDNKFIIIGSKLGMIRFGSRVDLVLPSKGLRLDVKENDYVNGPYTKIGEYIS
jgi:phosphatidylserine decarboxylase